MKRAATFLLLVAASTGTFVSAQSGILFDDVVDLNAAGEGALRPRITLNADGAPVVLWGRTNPNSNFVAIAEGSGFSAPIELSTPGCVPAVADWMGSSIASVGNVVWVVMKATPEEGKPVYVRRSDDGGYTWGDTLRVDPFDGLVSRFPTIAASEADMPLVQYMQFDNGWNGARQVVTHLMGTTFMTPVQVSAPFASGDVCDCCPNQIVTDGSRAIALYRNAGSNIRVIWGASSSNDGMSFPSGAQVDQTDWLLNACPSSGPDGYFAGDSLRYVWMSGANNGTKIHVGSALAADLSTGAQRFVSPGEPMGVQQNFPRIAGNGDTLGVVWENYSSGARDIYFSWSVAGVQGLSAPQLVNEDMTGSQRTPDIAFANGAFHIVWGEFGTNQIRYRRAAVTGPNGIADDRIPSSVVVWPNPVLDVLRIPGGGWVRAEVFDPSGRSIHAEPAGKGSIDLGALPTGEYTLVIYDRTGARRSARFGKL